MIIHADMDAFYASVEMRENPQLSGKPVAVGGPGAGRGVISAANYEARKYGVKSAMPSSIALRKCPHLILLPGRIALYANISKQIHAIFRQYTPQIEPLSLDEAFLDVTASQQLFGSAEEIGKRIKSDVAQQLQLVVSIGIAPNKFIAKIASDFDKPDGFVYVDKNNAQCFLDKLAVNNIWGVGKVTEKLFEKMGISTIKQLRQMNKNFLSEHFGKHGTQLWQLAHGIDNRKVETEREAKSISHEITFSNDVSTRSVLLSQLIDLTEQVAWRLRDHELMGKTISIKIRFADFTTITRSLTLNQASHSTKTIWLSVKNLFTKQFPEYCPHIRLVGVSVSGLQNNHRTEPEQIDLFDTKKPSEQKIDALSDAINKRFGKHGITRGPNVKPKLIS